MEKSSFMSSKADTGCFKSREVFEHIWNIVLLA